MGPAIRPTWIVYASLIGLTLAGLKGLWKGMSSLATDLYCLRETFFFSDHKVLENGQKLRILQTVR